MLTIVTSRIYQFFSRILSALLPWREPEVLRGEGAVLRLPEKLKADGVFKPLLVTGPTLARLGVPDGLVTALAKEGIQAVVFSRVNNDPTIANVEDACACYRESQCDGIIAFGGGSPMDCAKLCGARVARPKKSIKQLKGVLKIHTALPPLYAVPTTAGTGSEVTIAAVVSDENHKKFMVGDMALIPRVAVLDPALTRGMPRGVTAASGMDALSHAVEAYIGHDNTKATKAHAVEAVRLIFTYLPKACRDGDNMEARTAMQQAAFRAGLAFTRANVGYVHAVAHAVGGRYGLPHGLACGVAMPAVLRAYGSTAYKPLAALADAAQITKTAALTGRQKAEAFISAIETLGKTVGMPEGFAQLIAADIPTLARQAAKEGNRFYPAPKVLLEKELEAVLKTLAVGQN